MRDDAAMLCTECGKNHRFPEPKFQIGQRVLLARPGLHHDDRIGEVTTIRCVWRLFSMPCDEVEYITDLGDGSVLESRLEPVDGGEGRETVTIVHKPEFPVTRELVESTGPSPLQPAAIVYAESEKMRQECERRIAEAIKHASRPDLLVDQRSYATTARTIAKIPPVRVEDLKETCRLMRLQLDNLRARDKATLDYLTVVYSGRPVDPIITELDRLGFKVYLNIDYDPPCSGNAIVLLASEGKLVQFKSIHWGLPNEPERADCQDRCGCPEGV